MVKISQLVERFVRLITVKVLTTIKEKEVRTNSRKLKQVIITCVVFQLQHFSACSLARILSVQ